MAVSNRVPASVALTWRNVMRSRRSLPTLAALVAFASPAPAGPSALDLVPADATAAVAVRNLNELRGKGDKLLAAAEMPEELRPSSGFEFLFDYLGVSAAVDRDGSAAVMLVNPDVLGLKICHDDGNGNDFRWLDLIVAAVPFRDRDKIAACFGIKEGALKPDTMVRGRGRVYGEVFYAHGNHVFFGKNEKVVASAAKGARVGNTLTAARRRLLDDADAFVYVRREPIDPCWQRFLRDEEESRAKGGEEGQKEAAHRLFAAFGAVQDVWLALRVDEGLGLGLVCTFPKAGKPAVRKYLTELQAGPSPSDLNGLPDGDVILAEAFRGDGARNAALARFLLQQLLWDFPPAQQWVAASLRPSLLGVFTEVWKRLAGARIAVYRNADRERYGFCSAVAVLDTEDAEGFLSEMRQLARYAAGELDLAGPRGKDGDPADVAKLVTDLGDDRFAVRETASTKLGLIGEPALPFLEKGERSEDLEVRRRAREVRARITAAVKAAREQLASEALSHRFRPSFGFSTRPEMMDGRPVQLLRVKLEGKDQRAAVALRGLFGPEWDKVRLVVHGKRIAVLVGTDVGLLQKTLNYLEKGSPGLGAVKAFAHASGSHDSSRKAEIHLSLEVALRLLRGEDAKPGKANAGRLSLSSFALTVDPDYLRLDTWTPPSDMKALRRAREDAWRSGGK